MYEAQGKMEPIYERCFLPDNYACRKGKGTHAAMRRAQYFARRHPWAWKADIVRFFPSIDHATLKDLRARKVKDPHVLALAGRIIDHSNPQEEVHDLFPGDDLFTITERRRGLPLGNQTSQFFANVYLDPLDHFLKGGLRLPDYVRYTDDVVAFADSKQELVRARQQVRTFLQRYRLGKEAGVKPETVAPFIRRERDVRCETFARLCAALGLELVKKGD